MKKIFLLSIFLFILFCFPVFTLAAQIELTVTINGVRIPERAVMENNGFLPTDTEFRLPGGRIIIVRDNDKHIMASGSFAGAGSYIKEGQATTISFDYATGDAPYKIYAEFGVTKGTSETGYPICRANCSDVLNASGLPASDWYFFYLAYDNGYDWSSAYCPDSICHARYHDELAVDPVNVIDGRWRSPELLSF